MMKTPMVSIVLPAFNEAGLLDKNFRILHAYLQSLADYEFEIILVNDGSSDGTEEIVNALAAEFPVVVPIHHVTNFGLGQAFKSAFGVCRGDYVVTLDIDLSYSPDHIGALLDKISATRAKLVLASPYMAGGQISNVPGLRRTLSILANRFLSFFANGNLSTLTCMVRAYDGKFIRAMNLRSTGMDVMPETIYKSMILRGRTEQIPAHLDWGPQLAVAGQRHSSMRMLRHIFSTILSGFLFRPFMFFILPGLLLLVFSLYTNFWMILHFVDAYNELSGGGLSGGRISLAVAAAYDAFPHTFIVGLLTFMVAVQLISLGILALQTKGYFEEIFHLGSAIKRQTDEIPSTQKR